MSRSGSGRWRSGPGAARFPVVPSQHYPGGHRLFSGPSRRGAGHGGAGVAAAPTGRHERVKRLAQLEENLLAAQLTLSADDLHLLDAASAPTPEYPGWMVAMSEADRRELLASGELPATH